MAGADIFQDLKKSEIARITDSGVIRTVDSGKVLFRKGDVGHEMFIVLKGKIMLPVRKDLRWTSLDFMPKVHQNLSMGGSVWILENK